MSDSPIDAFIKALADLDDGDRAKLKRNAGNTPAEARNALGLFYSKLLRYIPVQPAEEDDYFLIATLYPFEREGRGNKQSKGKKAASASIEAEETKAAPRPRNFGATLHTIRTASNQEGLDRRFERLLDADRTQLPFLLRREIQVASNEGGRINWAQLLQDVRHWQHPDRFVQRNWARDYFTTPFNSNTQTDNQDQN